MRFPKGRAATKSVPPESSSHTTRHVIRITRLSLVGVACLLFCVSFPVLGWPAAFGWLLVIPVGVAVWVLRSQTVVTDAGLEAQSVFKTQVIEWDKVRGVRFPRHGWARADLGEGIEIPLPAVSFDKIQELSLASGGRIPDPYAQEPESDS